MQRFLRNDTVSVGALEVTLEVTQVDELAMELMLLIEGLVDSVQIGNDHATIALSVGRVSPPRQGRASVSETRVAAHLAKNQAGFLRNMLLRAYRDGLAEVNHTHLTLTTAAGEYDLTLMFPHHKEPLSPREAAVLLGV